MSDLIIDTRTQSALAELVRDADILEEQSQIPDQSNRIGFLVARYDAEADGGAVGAHEVGIDLPVGTYAVRGFAQVVTGVEPSNALVALSIESANDLLAATDLTSVGVHALEAGTSPVLVETAAKKITVTVSTAALTAGTVFIYLDLISLQPPA